MRNIVYSRYGFNIYQFPDGYIVHNTAKEFDVGHTHIINFNTATYLVRLCHTKRLPNDTPRYLIISLIRLSNDDIYTNKAQSLLSKKYKKMNVIKRRK